MKPNKLLRNRPCIYAIRNLTNDKVYVGKTKCIHGRMSQYIYDFKRRSLGHINDYLYRAMRKVGLDSFEMIPLEFCNVETLAERELHWMRELKSTDRRYGYNLRMDSSTGMITHERTSKKIISNLKRQWANGVRDEHSKKLKASWANKPEMRVEQSERMRKTLTKYQYEVFDKNGGSEMHTHRDLVNMGLHNIIANYHKKSSNDCTINGVRIVRHKL